MTYAGRKLSRIYAVARIANDLPCSAVHAPGAECVRCNPTAEVSGYRVGPDYGERRIALAREATRC